MQQAVKSRLAPTPSGYLHRGNAYNFLLTSYLIQLHSGELRLRIDNLDAPRVRREYLENIFETLHWLDIKWTKGPQTVAEQLDIYSQPKRTGLYNAALQKLVATGKVFACTCSRKEILENSVDGQYLGTCIHKKIPLETPDVAWRIVTEQNSLIQFEDELMGIQSIDIYSTNRHFIVRRRDGVPAYHIASLVDDVDFDINLIVRGNDLLDSTAAQLYLAQLLDFPPFTTTKFYHHPLINNADGTKLSKSAANIPVKGLIKDGLTSNVFKEEFRDWLGGFL